MKKWSVLKASVVAFCITLLFSGCVKDQCERMYTYTYYLPVYKTRAEVRENIRSNTPRSVEKPGKLYIRGSYIFLNEVDRGIHIIDNSNPSAPKNVAFIDIPGNVDLAVKGNTLYADLYTDLVALDISNPLQVKVEKIIDGVFPDRFFGNGFTANNAKVIADWVKRDTTVKESCAGGGGWGFIRTEAFFSGRADAAAPANAGASNSPFGAGGSMARFAIKGERMYTVGRSDLNVFNISTTNNPAFVVKKQIGWNIETIFPFKNNLFIGSNNGMFIFNVGNPDNPVQTGQFSHVVSCDPVIADDSYAYVTLRNGTFCRNGVNQLDVLQLNMVSNPNLLKSYQMTNPHGLSKDGDLLFLCDGKDGLKVFDASDVRNLKLLQQIRDLETYDVIAFNDIALVVAADGLYQYDYSNPSGLRLLSKITIQR